MYTDETVHVVCAQIRALKLYVHRADS